MDDGRFEKLHEAMGAKMEGQGDLSWPARYARGPFEEHLLVRRSLGLADLSVRGASSNGTEADHRLLDFLSAHPSSALLLCEGPKAVPLLEAVSGDRLPMPGTDAPLSAGNISCDAFRWSLGGEDGCLLACRSEELPMLWKAMAEAAASAGVEAGPVGAQALESLAFEAGLPSPALLLGRTARPPERPLASGMTAAVVTIKAGLPAPGAELRGLGRPVGRCMEGFFCPSLGLFSSRVGVEGAFASPGTPLLVLINGGEKECRVAQAPLYRGSAPAR